MQALSVSAYGGPATIILTAWFFLLPSRHTWDSPDGYCELELEENILNRDIPTEDIEEAMSLCNLEPSNEAKLVKPSEITSNVIYSISPVPANELLNIYSNIEHGQIRIVNSLGQLLFDKPINYDLTIEVSKFPRGIYVINCYSNGVISFSKNVIFE